MEAPQELWLAIIVLVLLMIVVAWLRRLFRRRRPGRLPPVDLSIDVTELGDYGPPPEGPIVDYQGVPARVAAIVLAPAGRARPLPARDRWDQVWEAIAPGLSRVVAEHQPLVRSWPPQLSESGFVHSFFGQLKLSAPTEGPSPWCAVAGPVRLQDQVLLVGILFRTDEPTTLGTESIDNPYGWRRVLAVRYRR